jgi:hypothetical protein
MPSASAQVGSYQQWCQAGDIFANTSGITSTTPMQGSFPLCQVSVVLTGTSTPATLYSTITNTPLANPFCANADGSFKFFAAVSTGYDITISNSSACNPAAGGYAQLPASFTWFDAFTSGAGGTTGLPTSPQTGDTLCYNCNEDLAWDAANYARPFVGVYALNQAVTPFVSTVGTLYGLGSPSVTENSATAVYPTATLGYGVTFTSSESASTSTVIGLSFGQNGSTSLIGMQAFYRWSYRASMGNTASVRYWMGLCTFHSPGTGNNGLACNGSAAYATDSPNKSTEAFLYDPTINSHWQAVVDTAGGSQTTVDTGVVEDTNIHLWEMTTSAAGTSILFWIDGTNVATISSNLPPPANDYDSWGSLFFTGDNQYTATAVSETFYSMQMSLK